MKNLIAASLAAFGFMASGPMMNGAYAQDKKADKASHEVTTKVMVENDKVRAQEVTFPPGATNTAVATSSMRVVRALTSGKLQRVYADGKKEDVAWAAGQVRLNEASAAYTAKNVGKGTLKLYVVILK